jgi:hypothetical protein
MFAKLEMKREEIEAVVLQFAVAIFHARVLLRDPYCRFLRRKLLRQKRLGTHST